MATGHVGEFPVGSLVRIREPDWVVLPSDDTDILCLRPLSGSESEICGIHREIEGHALKHGPEGSQGGIREAAIMYAPRDPNFLIPCDLLTNPS